MPYTEFYCNSAVGDNRNAGSTTGAHHSLWTSASWVSATGVFTVSSGNPVTSGVTVGMFASVYPVAAVFAPYVALIVNVTSTAITLSLTFKTGTAPTDSVTSDRAIRVGGCWKGPNVLEDFPFGVMASTLNDGVNLTPRVNFKGTFNVTGAIAHGVTDSNPVIWEGYTTTPGDGGMCTILSPFSGASYTVLTLGNTLCRRQWLENFIFTYNGSTGSATTLVLSSVIGGARNIYVNNSRGIGITCSGAGGTYVELEVFACNNSGTVDLPGIAVTNTCRVIRSIARSCNKHGFGTTTSVSNNPTLLHCIAADNNGSGFSFKAPGGTAGGSLFMQNCDAYSNAQDGLRIEAAGTPGTILVQDSNFIENTG